MKTGDAIATVAQPIAKTIDYFLGTNIQGCSGCKKMQNNLNSGMSLTEAFIERLKRKEKDEFSERTEFGGGEEATPLLVRFINSPDGK